MRLKLVAAAVTIAALAMPAAAMAGGEGGAGPGDSASANHGAAGSAPAGLLAFGAGYQQPGGSPQVRALQRRLAAEGFRPGPIDGLYGPRTAAAVSRFQAASGLAPDGVAGPATRRALSSPVSTVYPGAGYGPGGSRLVRRVQRLLIRAGYRPGRVDGRYGPRTQQAVRRFQAAHQLTVDGIAHPATVIALAGRIQTPRHPRSARPSRTARRPATSPTPAAPTTASPTPAQVPAPVIARHPRQPSGTSPLPWVGILAAVIAIGLMLTAVLYTRHRAGRPGSPANPDGVDTHPVTNGVPANGAQTDKAFRLGVLLEEQSDLQGAEAAYHRADEQGHAAAASNLGVLLERRGDLPGAEAAYRRADERGDPNGAFNLAMLLEERHDLKGAQAAYRRADEQGHAAAASNLGVLLERRRDLAGAEAAYRRADERGDPNGAFNLAVLLEEKGDLAGAKAAYGRADERGPADVANAARAALLSLKEAAGQSSATNRREARVG